MNNRHSFSPQIEIISIWKLVVFLKVVFSNRVHISLFPQFRETAALKIKIRKCSSVYQQGWLCVSALERQHASPRKAYINSRVHASFCSVKTWRMRTWNPEKVILLHNMWPQCFRTNLLLACKIGALNIFSYNSFLHSWVDCDPGSGYSNMCSTESSTIKCFCLYILSCCWSTGRL